VMMPLFGSLADLHGRRRVLLVALGLFLLGALRCAAAQTMPQLDFKQLRLVHRVGITLRTRDARPGVFSEFFTLSADVHLRNR